MPTLLTVPGAAAAADPCANASAIAQPGAELQRVECQPDLSATALSVIGRSDTSDWAQLHSKQSRSPPAARRDAWQAVSRAGVRSTFGDVC